MSKELKLNEKEFGNPKALDEPVYKSKDIKEFIRRLKEELKEQEKVNCGSLYLNEIEDEIDKLSGFTEVKGVEK